MSSKTHGNSIVRRIRLAAGLALLLTVALAFAADPPSVPPGVVATLRGHGEAVYATAFSPDGKLVATGSFDKSIRVWESETGKLVRTLSGPAGHQNLVLSVAFSPDGRQIASGGSDNAAKIWDVPSSSPVQTYALGGQLAGLALSPDGSRLAGVSADGTLKIWTTADGKEVANVPGQGGQTKSLQYSANGALLVLSAGDGLVRVVNAANGQPMGSIGAHTSLSTSVVHPNSVALSSAGDGGSIKTWQLPPPAPRPIASAPAGVVALALTADGNQVFAAGADRIVRLHQFANGQIVRPLAPIAGDIKGVATTSNGSQAAAFSDDKSVSFWNAADGKLLGQWRLEAGPTALAMQPQGGVIAAGAADGMVRIVAAPPVEGRSLAHPDAVLALAPSADGKRLFTAGKDKLVRSWDQSTGKIERPFPGHGAAVLAVAVSPNGQTVASSSADETIRLWNAANGQQIGVFAGQTAPIAALALHPNGQLLLAAGEDGSLKAWRVPAEAPKVLAHPDQVLSSAVSGDGKRVATAGADKQVRLWNAANGQAERTLGSALPPITALAVSTDGAQTAAAFEDKSAIVWNSADGKEIKKLPGLPGVARALAFTPDGKGIVLGLADNSLRLYDIAQGKETRSFAGHAGPIVGLAVPTADSLVSASQDKSIVQWKLSDGRSLSKIDAGGAITAFAVSKDGKRIAAGLADKQLKTWNAGDGKPIASAAQPADIKAVSFHADGLRLGTGLADGSVRLLAEDLKPVEVVKHEGPVTSLSMLPGGKAFLSTSADKTARMWNSNLLWVSSQKEPLRFLALSSAGDWVASAGDGPTIRVRQTSDGKETRAIQAHTGAVTSLLVSADGKRIISAGSDKFIKIWDAAAPAAGKGETALATIATSAAPRALAIHPDGSRVAAILAGDKGATVSVFATDTGAELLSASGMDKATNRLSFGRGGRTLFVTTNDNAVREVDVGVVRAWSAHPGGVSSVAFLGNGAQVATAGADRTIKLWDVNTGKMIRTFGPVPEAITAIAVSKDSTEIAAVVGKTIKVWSLADGKETVSLTQNAPLSSVDFGPDKSRLVAASPDGNVRLWDRASGRELQWFRHAGAVVGLAYHPNGTTILSAGADKTLVANSIALQRLFPAQSKPVKALAVTPNGTHLLSAGDDKAIAVLNLGSGAQERTIPVGDSPIVALAVSKNGALIAAAGADKATRVITFADGKALGQFSAENPVRSLAFSPNNLILAAACERGPSLAWNVNFTAGQPTPPEFGKVLQIMPTAALDASFAPDNATVYTGGGDKSLQMWKIASEAPTKNLAHANLVDAVAFHPNQPQLATGSHDGTVRIWDVAKGTQTRQIAAHAMPAASPVYSVAWSQDGKTLASSSLDKSLKLWDAADGKMVREFKGYKEKESEKGHRDGVFAAALSPDGKLLASGSSDRTIKLWNTADGAVVREFINPQLKSETTPGGVSHPGWVYGLRFTADGKHLVSVGNAPRYQGYLAVWNVADGRLLYGEQLGVGPIHSVDVSRDGRFIVLGCGPRARQAAEVEAYVIRMPDVVTKAK